MNITSLSMDIQLPQKQFISERSPLFHRCLHPILITAFTVGFHGLDATLDIGEAILMVPWYILTPAQVVGVFLK